MMRRLLILAVAIAAVIAATPPAAPADASCDAVAADLPILTDNIQTEWVVENCSAQIRVRVSLSEYVNGDWQRADCSQNDTGQCTRVHPTDAEGAACDPFYCAYGTNHQTDTWRQDDSPCGHLYRTKVVVTNRDGDIIASDASVGNQC